MNDLPVSFSIDPASLQRRRKNILWGAILSLVLTGLMLFANTRFPQTYNETLLWSIIGFLAIGNLVNFIRHRRYLRLVQDHRIEVRKGRIDFFTWGEKTTLNLNDVAAVFVYRRRGELRHLQVRLKNNRGIRLEGYKHLEGLKNAIAAQIPADHLVDRKI